MSQHSGSPHRPALLPPAAVTFLHRRAVETAGLLLFALATALALALASYRPEDAALNVAAAGGAANWLGTPGAWAADLLLQTLGLASIAVVGIMACWAWRIASHRGLPWYGLRLALAPPALLLLAALAGSVTAPEQWPQAAGLGGFGGDWLLQISTRPLAVIAQTPGSPLVLAAGTLTTAILVLYLLGIRLAEWLALAKAGIAGTIHTLGAA
ncbi:MAG: cell division protein FtsK, partial [Rhodospirillaceae bacterium]|nr:cell division protein FtsK [Rhodospirillaceae bacterium]